MRYGTLLQGKTARWKPIEQFWTGRGTFFQQHGQGIEALACYEAWPNSTPRIRRAMRFLENRRAPKALGYGSRSYLPPGSSYKRPARWMQRWIFRPSSPAFAGRSRRRLALRGAKLRKGDAEGAVLLLDPLSSTTNDTTYLAIYGEALLRTGRWIVRRMPLESYYKQNLIASRNFLKLPGYIRTGQEGESGSAADADQGLDARPAAKKWSLRNRWIISPCCTPPPLHLRKLSRGFTRKLNRETKYFDALVRLFDLYLAAGQMKEACEALDRLVDIDPYDYRNQERIAKLEGKVDPAFMQNILARAARRPPFRRGTKALPEPEEIRARTRGTCPRKCARSRRSRILSCRWRFSCNIPCK